MTEKEKILDYLQYECHFTGPIEPSEIALKIGSATQRKEFVIILTDEFQKALWELIEAGKVSVTSDWKIEFIN